MKLIPNLVAISLATSWLAASSTVRAQPGTITTVAGGGPGEGPALATPLGRPTGTAVDRAGNLYIAATLLNRVFKVDPGGQLTIVAGVGEPGSLGDGGPATDAAVSLPAAVAVDTRGNVFIAEPSRIRRVDAATGIITTVAGSGAYGFSGDGGLAIDAALAGPVGIAVDRGENLFIAEELANRVRRVDAATGIITTVAGTGQRAFSGDGGPATSAALAQPVGVAVDEAGNLFIVDRSNQRVRRVDAATGIITTVAGNGTVGFGGDGGPATSAILAFPAGVAVDEEGNLSIVDRGNQRVRRVDAATGVITTVAGNGRHGFSGDGGPATSAALALVIVVPGLSFIFSPTGIAHDADGNLFIADTSNHRIRRVDAATGIITTVAGNGTERFGGDGGPATSATLSELAGVAVDGAGNLFIVDQRHYRIRRVDAATGIMTTVAGNGSMGFSGDGGPATEASFTFVFPEDPHVPQVDLAGVAADGAGNLFIADFYNARVRRVDAATGIITTVAGYGLFTFSGDGGPATSAGMNPVGVAVDGAGNLFIADRLNNRIRRVDAATGIITTVAGTGSYGFSGDGGPATSATLASATGVAVDRNGHLFIAGNRIRRVDAATGIITTVAGNGSYGFSGDGGPATSAALGDVVAVAVDGDGHLFIAERSNHRIRRVDAATRLITTVAGTGSEEFGGGFSGDGGPATSAALGRPVGVAVDAAGNLFIAERANRRVRRVEAAQSPRYPFTGFLPPVQNPPALNERTAGSAVPLKFSLGGDRGLAVLAAGYPKVRAISCDTRAPVDDTTVTARVSSLRYDPATDQYVSVLKTDEAWTASCRQLVLVLADGTVHVAYFKFK